MDNGKVIDPKDRQQTLGEAIPLVHSDNDSEIVKSFEEWDAHLKADGVRYTGKEDDNA
jgi:hypothetical protein